MTQDKWIDKNQAKVFIGISLFILIAFGLVVGIWGERPFDFEKIEAQGFSLGIGVSGMASAVVLLSILWAHEKEYWGEGKDSYPFIIIGALITLIAACVQLMKAFLSVLP